MLKIAGLKKLRKMTMVLEKVISEIFEPLNGFMILSWDCIIKIFKKDFPGFQYGLRRSFSLKAKLSETEVTFFLTLKRKKVFFSFCSHTSETLQAKTMEAKRKELSEKLQFL